MAVLLVGMHKIGVSGSQSNRVTVDVVAAAARGRPTSLPGSKNRPVRVAMVCW